MNIGALSLVNEGQRSSDRKGGIVSDGMCKDTEV
jgi:hypothetical protein